MDIGNIASFLKKYEKLPVPKRQLISALNEFLESKDLVKDVHLSKGVLYVKTTNAAKQVLFIKKEKVIQFLKEKNLPIAYSDIR